MTDYKEILGVITIIIAVVSYSTYFYNIFTTCTLPRTASWFIWGVLNAIAFSVQFQAGAGSGAWVTGFTACMCLLIAVISFVKCDEHFTMFDLWPLGAALVTLFLWCFTDSALLATILITVTCILGFIPTLHNAYLHPEEEVPTTFALNSLKFFISLFALSTYSLTTWLYPSVVLVLNAVLVAVILIRKRTRKI
jgi:hypothetical protein